MRTTLMLRIFILNLLFISSIVTQLFAQETKIVRIAGQELKEETQTEAETRIVKRYYKNNSLHSVEVYKNNKPNGKWDEYYNSGIIHRQREFKDSILITERNYFGSGTLSTEKNFALKKEGDKFKPELDGAYLENFENASPKTRGQYQMGKKQGEWTYFYNSGNKEKTITYKEDIVSGKMTTWYISGKINSEKEYLFCKIKDVPEYANQNKYLIADYRKGENISVPNGISTSYFQSGNISSRSKFKLGKKEGLSETWYENGKLKEHINYKNNFENGQTERWFENGSLEESYNVTSSYDSIKKMSIREFNGKQLKYNRDGRLKLELNYANGKKHGKQLEYDANGETLIKEEYYEQGLLTGDAKTFSPNGILIALNQFKTEKVNDTLKSIRQGWEKAWYPNGQLKYEKLYANGVAEGKVLVYNEKGQVQTEENYLKGKLNGKYSKWANGLLVEDGYYKTLANSKKNLMDSVWNYYRNDSSISRHRMYKNGRPLVFNNYNALGNLTEENLVVDPAGDLMGESYIVKRYYANGQIAQEYFYARENPIQGSSSRARGTTLFYYPNGKLKNIENDYKGYHATWLPNGACLNIKFHRSYSDFDTISDASIAKNLYDAYTNRPAPEGKTINGKKDGLWIYWFDKEHKQYEQNFKEGKLDGLFTAYYANGKKMLEMDMKDGFPYGNYAFYETNGNYLVKGKYNKGLLFGSQWTMYYPNGFKSKEIIIDSLDLQKRYITEWYERGNFKKVSTTLGNYAMNTDSIKEWHENGQLKYKAYMQNGKLQGFRTEYYSNGKSKIQGLYINGKREGEHLEWYENGNLKQRISYANEQQNGIFETFYENGKPKLSAHYTKDKEDGEWIQYDELGAQTNKKTYSKGYLTYQPSEYCECVDSTMHKLNYAPMLNNITTLDEVRKWSFNIHAPIGDFFNNLFYINYQFSGSGKAVWRSFDIIAFEPIYLQIPDEKGFKLIANPCKNLASRESRTNFNIRYQVDNKQSIDAELEVKKIALEFNPKLLHVWDKAKNRAASPQIPTRAYFDCDGIDYNSQDLLKVEKAKLNCFNTAEIGNTGMLIELLDALIDLNPQSNPDEMAQHITTNIWDSKKPNSFVGIYANKANISLPGELSKGEALATSVYINNQKIAGVIEIKNIKASSATDFQLATGYTFTESAIKDLFEEKGILISKPVFDSKTMSISFTFNYSTK